MPTDTTYAAIKSQQDALVRKSLDGGVWIADSSVDALTRATLFSATTGALQALPTGYKDLGYLDTSGAQFSRKVTSTDLQAWQSLIPVRTDITADDVTCQFVAMETNATVVSLMNQVDPASISTTPDAGGSIEIDKPAVPTSRFYRMVAFGVDLDNDGDTIIARFFPRARVTDYATQTLANGSDALTYGITMTAYVDDTLGYSEAVMYGGAGFLAKLTAMGFTAGT